MNKITLNEAFLFSFSAVLCASVLAFMWHVCVVGFLRWWLCFGLRFLGGGLVCRVFWCVWLVWVCLGFFGKGSASFVSGIYSISNKAQQQAEVNRCVPSKNGACCMLLQ